MDNVVLVAIGVIRDWPYITGISSSYRELNRDSNDRLRGKSPRLYLAITQTSSTVKQAIQSVPLTPVVQRMGNMFGDK